MLSSLISGHKTHHPSHLLTGIGIRDIHNRLPAVDAEIIALNLFHAVAFEITIAVCARKYPIRAQVDGLKPISKFGINNKFHFNSQIQLRTFE